MSFDSSSAAAVDTGSASTAAPATTWTSGQDLPAGNAPTAASPAPAAAPPWYADPKNIGLATQAAGVVMSTMGAYKKSSSDQYAYEYQSKIAANNAALAEFQARDAIARGKINEANQKLKTAQLKSTQTASLAARGLDLGEGNAADILQSTNVMGERDVATIHSNAIREAWGFQTQASNYRGNADILKNRAAAEDPVSNAASTFLTGAGTVASSWYKQSKAS